MTRSRPKSQRSSQKDNGLVGFLNRKFLLVLTWFGQKKMVNQTESHDLLRSVYINTCHDELRPNADVYIMSMNPIGLMCDHLLLINLLLHPNLALHSRP